MIDVYIQSHKLDVLISYRSMLKVCLNGNQLSSRSMLSLKHSNQWQTYLESRQISFDHPPKNPPCATTFYDDNDISTTLALVPGREHKTYDLLSCGDLMLAKVDKWIRSYSSFFLCRDYFPIWTRNEQKAHMNCELSRMAWLRAKQKSKTNKIKEASPQIRRRKKRTSNSIR